MQSNADNLAGWPCTTMVTSSSASSSVPTSAVSSSIGSRSSGKCPHTPPHQSRCAIMRLTPGAVCSKPAPHRRPPSAAVEVQVRSGNGMGFPSVALDFAHLCLSSSFLGSAGPRRCLVGQASDFYACRVRVILNEHISSPSRPDLWHSNHFPKDQDPTKPSILFHTNVQPRGTSRPPTGDVLRPGG